MDIKQPEHGTSAVASANLEPFTRVQGKLSDLFAVCATVVDLDDCRRMIGSFGNPGIERFINGFKIRGRRVLLTDTVNLAAESRPQSPTIFAAAKWSAYAA